MELNVSGIKVLIDDEDFHLTTAGTLYLSTGAHLSNYVSIKYPDGKFKKLHRVIMNAKDDEEVDHKNRNPADNRKANLRICSHSVNCRNRGDRAGKSLPKGVSKSPYGFRARIQINSKENKFLGTFKTEEEASAAYIAATLKYWSETE